MKPVSCICKFALILLLISSVYTENSSAQWTQTNGPYGGFNLPLAVSGTNIFAGKYRSTNSGANWTSMNMTSIASYYLLDMAAMGTDLYAISLNAYRSTDYGASWIDISAGTGLGVSCIAASNNIVYAGGQGTVYISTNNGANWTPSTNNIPVNDIVNRVFASGANIFITCNNKMYRSTNSGANWNPAAGMQTRNIYNFTSMGSSYFACGDSGVYISTNAGADWQKTSAGLPPLEPMACLTSNGNALFAGGQSSGVYRSTNNGATWSLVNNGITGFQIRYMTSMGTDVYCENNKGIYRSTDNGNTWVSTNTGMTGKDFSLFASIGNNIFAGSGSSGDIFRSSDEGGNWQNVSAGLGTATVRGLAAKGSNLYVSISPVTGDTTQGIFKSTNNGANWSRVNTGYASALAASTDKIYAGLYNGFIASTNDGVSWENVNIPNPTSGVNKLAVSGNLVIAASIVNYYVSTNAGVNWVTGTYPPNAQFSDISITGSNVYAVGSGSGHGFYKSTNNGLNWTLLNAPGNFVLAGIEYNNDLFIASDSGVYRSTNGGVNWIKRNQGLVLNSNLYYSTTMMKFFPFNGNMYAGTLYSSVWKAPISYLTVVQNISTEIPEKFLLSQNYPNPFNPITKINFSLPVNSYVKLIVYNSIGKEVANLVSEKLSAGSYAYEFNGEMLSSGVYYYKLETENFSETKKMVLVK